MTTQGRIGSCRAASARRAAKPKRATAPAGSHWIMQVRIGPEGSKAQARDSSFRAALDQAGPHWPGGLRSPSARQLLAAAATALEHAGPRDHAGPHWILKVRIGPEGSI